MKDRVQDTANFLRNIARMEAPASDGEWAPVRLALAAHGVQMQEVVDKITEVDAVIEEVLRKWDETGIQAAVERLREVAQA